MKLSVIDVRKHVAVMNAYGIEWSELTKLMTSSNDYQALWKRKDIEVLNIVYYEADLKSTYNSR